MKNNPLISVIIPIYNGEKYIAQALESVMKQPCKNLEIIIVNDGSIDKSGQICKTYQQKDDRIQYFYQENSGVCEARNLGMDKARGKYLAFLDADDVLVKNFYDKKLAKQLLQDENDIFCFGYILSDEKLKRGTLVKAQKISNDKYDAGWNHFSSYLYLAKNIKDNKIKFNKGRKFQEDCEFRFKSFCISKTIKCSDKYMFIYRNNKFSVTHAKINTIEILNESVNAWKDILKWLYIDKYKYDSHACDICNTMIITYSFEYIAEAAKNGETFENINENLRRYNLLDILKNPSNVYLDRKSLEAQKQYLFNGRSYCKRIKRKNTLKHICLRLNINKIGIFRKVYELRRYKTNLQQYVY